MPAPRGLPSFAQRAGLRLRTLRERKPSSPLISCSLRTTSGSPAHLPADACFPMRGALDPTDKRAWSQCAISASGVRRTRDACRSSRSSVPGGHGRVTPFVAVSALAAGLRSAAFRSRKAADLFWNGGESALRRAQIGLRRRVRREHPDDQLSNPVRLFVEREVPCVGDRDQGHVGALLERAALVVG